MVSPVSPKPESPKPESRKPGKRGTAAFTLLELIVVIAVVGILAAIAMPNFIQTPKRAKESVLKTNLRTLREVIDQHFADKARYPESLEALVEAGYLRKIPNDPMIEKPEWELIYEEATSEEDAPPETELEEGGGGGIMDVKSTSTGLSLDGTPYNEW
jgi:general secretion pathway protein G